MINLKDFPYNSAWFWVGNIMTPVGRLPLACKQRFEFPSDAFFHNTDDEFLVPGTVVEWAATNRLLTANTAWEVIFCVWPSPMAYLIIRICQDLFILYIIVLGRWAPTSSWNFYDLYHGIFPKQKCQMMRVLEAGFSQVCETNQHFICQGSSKAVQTKILISSHNKCVSFV